MATRALYGWTPSPCSTSSCGRVPSGRHETMGKPPYVVRPGIDPDPPPPERVPLAAPGDTQWIQLTRGPTVRIRGSEWPELSSAEEVEHGYPGSPKERAVWMRVRRHSDGRKIVYAARTGQCSIRCGELLDPADGLVELIAALRRLQALVDAPAVLVLRLIATLPVGSL